MTSRPLRLAAHAVALALIGAAPASAATLPPSGTLDLSTEADSALVGAAPGDAFGWSVAGVGDVNGDGRPDVAVGAPLADPGGRRDAGSVFVVFGGTGLSAGRLDLGALGDRGFRIDGAAPGDLLGYAVAGAGDQDGDGKADLVLGAPRAPESATPGSAHLVPGRSGGGTTDLAGAGAPGTRLIGTEAGDQAGVAVAGGEDVDGDGLADVVVGASRTRSEAGAAFVVLGRRDSEAGAAPAALELGALGARGLRLDGTAGSLAGNAVGLVRDMTGDGRAEVVVGAPLAARPATPTGSGVSGDRAEGAAYAVFGRGAGEPVALAALGDGGLSVFGTGGEQLGVSVAGLPDLDGDGRPEIALGAPRADRGGRRDAGAVHVLFGRAAAGQFRTDRLGQDGARIDGALGGDRTGADVASAGDVDGDGRGDVLAGAPRADPLGRADAGAASVLFTGVERGGTVDLAGLGARGERLAGTGNDRFVRASTGVGDVDGDGASDILVGEVDGTNAREDGERRGTAFFVLGPKPLPPATAPQPDPGAQEEVAAGCMAADNVELVIDDSGSMVGSDPDGLRGEAAELLLAKPRNVGRVLGAVEFGDSARAIFPPQPVIVDGPRANAAALSALVEEAIGADDGGTNYNAAFTALTQENPGAKARILLTDGAHAAGAYRGGHRGGPPTYVIGLGIGRSGSAADRLERIARETGGRYFPRTSADRLQPVLNVIDSRLNCDLALDSFVDTITDREDELEGEEVVLDQGINSADLTVSWADPEDEIAPGDLELSDEEGEVTRVSGRTLARAIRRSGQTTVDGITVSGREGRTFFTLRIAGARAGRVSLGIRARRIAGRSARVHLQVAQSRRRR